MLGVRRSVLAGAVAAAVLAVPAAASAAPSVVASAVPGVPQDCQAGCIGSIRVSCAAADPLGVETTVRCWTKSYNVLTSTQSAPAAALTTSLYSGGLGGFTLCVEGISRHADGTTASSGVHCVPADDVGTAFVTG